MKSILVTGGAGFIGVNFVKYFVRKYPDYKVVVLDKLTYAGKRENLSDCDALPNFVFIKGDICDKDLVNKIFDDYDIKGVIHFAAESHVDNSIKNPGAFIQTNVVGTFTLVEAARTHWLEAPFKVKAGYEDCRFHHISTDEVYGSLGETGYFTEETPYDPSSPYSSSKASSDHIVRAYHRTYGLNVTVSNCSNNYGPFQHEEKLIPTVIKKCLTNQPIGIYGNGKNIRDWLFVLDHCKAIDLIFHTAKAGSTYNVGGHNERTNVMIVNRICEILDQDRPRKDGKSYKEQITFIGDRPGHDMRYAIDPNKIMTELGWKPDETFDTGIVKTVKWYLEQY
ncbi:MAG: dTDP-glucose 4,6-dehydratase [Succinivibrionaceae bacterium]|nr:dTDP-glucose 4,6-dehydratase [Succinivibrionaceae bacterium]